MSIVSRLSQWLRLLIAPPVPVRLRHTRRVRLFAALGAGLTGTLAFVIVYYATLGLLPWVFAYPTTDFPVGAWAHRFDLSQFLGSFLHPPSPTPFTWVLGLVVICSLLTGLGLLYAVLLAWSLQPSNAAKGLGFGLAVGAGLIGLISISDGLHPAIMRNALADPGAFLIGWSNWAPIQLLLAHAVYGAVLGRLYAHR